MKAASWTAGLVALANMTMSAAAQSSEPLALDWTDRMLTIRGGSLPSGAVKVWYLEAYCRSGSRDRDWNETVIPHRSVLVERSPTAVRLRDTLEDGVIVDHAIRSTADDVEFRVTATNPTKVASQAHWAQPCIRVGPFCGLPEKHAAEEYLPQCFVFLDGKPTRMPTKPWATKARYTPGQVWCPAGVDRNDVNPRPLSTLVPSNGLIGCYAADGKLILATAWEPYQELFQGVIVCLHSDFRIGGLQPGETKRIRGKIYLTRDMDDLLKRYKRDFGKG
jgi:hypothetical protein